MCKILRVIGLIVMIGLTVWLSLVVSRWIWSWDIPEWAKVWLIST